ncbi:hypothetical protein A8135_09125 [Legionella jamestowniensis]|uniref:LidA long coiled-coil domain-containing protein n=1 Tax=Legionella jamestowniensis TaxID=455 RepID=A0ABX2XW84_9GAMM|nr:hypothetical protein [Legionella jamestowniensis]OCH98914.1 hypothetical protein A8135_09125 [Legionella jamestowniensis]
MANSTKVDSKDILEASSEINKERFEPTKEPVLTAKSTNKSDESIEIRTSQNKTASLTASHLEQWFANLEARNQKENQKDKHVPDPHDPEVHPSYLATIYLSRYGLKTPKDVITFLKSPAGRDVVSMIGQQLAEIESIKEAIQLEQKDHEIRRHRALAALLLGLLYEREARAKEKNTEIQKEIDKKLHKSSDNAASDVNSDLAKAQAQHAAYTESINALQKTLSDKLEASEKLEEELELELQTLNEQDVIIENRYDLFENNLDALDQYALLLRSPSMSPEERNQTLVQLEQKIAQLQEQLSTTDDKSIKHQLDSLQTTYSILQKQTEAPESTTEHLEFKINKIEETLKKQAGKISDLIAGGQEEKARALLHKHNGLHVQYEGLRDMVAVLKGKKVLWSVDGQPMSTTDFGESGFILSKEQSIVLHNGKYYLLGKNQSPENFPFMKEEEKREAQKSFERARPSISNLKTLVHHNKTLEKGLQSEKREAINARSEAMQKEILLISNQLTKLQAARADTELLIKQLNKLAPEIATDPRSTTPVPSPKPSTSKSTQTANTQVIAQSYRHILLLMKANPTPQSVSRLESILRRPDGTIDSSTQAVLASIRYGQPIPQQTMNSLLKNMERLGISAYKPNVTRIPRPRETAHDDQPAPTPFSKTPYPKP